MKATPILGLITAFALLLAGCDSGGSNPPPETNEAPTANATASVTMVEAGETVQLDGTGSSDPDGDALTYSWSLDGPDGSTAALSDGSTADPTFVADVEGEYVATLSVSDGQADDADEVAITASPCPPQMIDSNITSDQTFPDVCFAEDRFDYVVSGMPDVEAVATFEAGVRVGFEEEAGFRVNDGGAILAQGTQDAPILMTGLEKTPGFWRGLYFRADNPTSELNYVIGDYGGHIWGGVDEAATIVVGNDAQLSLTHSTIRNSSGSGVYLEPRARLTEFGNNTFEENATHSVFIPDVQMGSTDTASSYGADVLVYATVGIDREMDVSPLSVDGITGPDYWLRGFFEVNAPVTLEPGVYIRMGENAAMRINDGGALIAEGTEERKIWIGAPVGSPWRGILFRADDLESRLNWVEVRTAGSEALIEHGGNDVAATLLVESDARLSLENSTIGGFSYGLFLKPRAKLTAFRNNAFDNGGDAAMYIPDRQMGVISEDTDISHDPGRYVRVYATIGVDDPMTISPIQGGTYKARYRVHGIVNVNASVTVEPRALLEFEEGAGVRVNDGGALIAQGTEDEKIVMTGVEEVPGFWRGILFRADDKSSELSNVTISDGGREAWGGADEPANITMEDTRLSVTNSTIRRSGGWGVWLDTPKADFANVSNTFEGNAKGSVGGND